jgi:voltage-gated potassium channel
VLILIQSSVLYWVEHLFSSEYMSRPDSPYSFTSMPEAIWLGIVTVSTVGYGDKFPWTVVGKAITGCYIITSVLFMALPIAIVGNAFVGVWKDR